MNLPNYRFPRISKSLQQTFPTLIPLRRNSSRPTPIFQPRSLPPAQFPTTEIRLSLLTHIIIYIRTCP
ncbi:MAG: hypothetical protein LBH04_01055 [Tannerellaceae bacterium]|nr:hypothetical protein [Tannerellaceae bacterium]